MSLDDELRKVNEVMASTGNEVEKLAVRLSAVEPLDIDAMRAKAVTAEMMARGYRYEGEDAAAAWAEDYAEHVPTLIAALERLRDVVAGLVEEASA